MSAVLKICGVRSAEELLILDRYSVDLAGVWYGISEGVNTVTKSQLSILAAQHVHSTQICLVTLQNDIDEIIDVVREFKIQHLQLHGFLLPNAVKKIRDALGKSVTIYKVLHIEGETCLEARWLEQYKKSGVDVFILDHFAGKHSIGSTGEKISQNFLNSHMPSMSSSYNIMLAGGVDAEYMDAISQRYSVFGFDIDSFAKYNGTLCLSRIDQITTIKNKIKLLQTAAL